MEKEYQDWLNGHLSSLRGERLRRLQDGHGEAERLLCSEVWWPAFGTFSGLHPEFKIIDFRGGTRYLDFAYIRGNIRICIEIDGYGPHWRDASRRDFSDERMRQNHLVIDGWHVIRFTYDDLRERPRQYQQILLQLLGRLFADIQREDGSAQLSVLEKEAIRLAHGQGGIIHPVELSSRLGLRRVGTQNLLSQLVDKKWLIPAGGTVRIRSYRLNPAKKMTF